MRFTLRTLLAAVAALALVGTAQAQRQPGGGGFGGGGFGGGGNVSLRAMLVQSKPLQEELKLTEEQITKLKEFNEKQTESMRRFGFGGSDEEQVERLTAQLKLLQERIALMKNTLTKEQLKRMSQIELQQQGASALTSEKIVKELKLSDEQKEKIKATNDELQKELREAQRGAFGGGFDQEKLQEMQKKTRAMREEGMEKMIKVLNSEQRSAWKELTGEPFDTSKLTPMRRAPAPKD